MENVYRLESPKAARLTLDPRDRARTEHNGGIEIAQREDVPFPLRQAVLERTTADAATEARRIGELAGKIHTIQRGYQREVQSLFGESRHERFRERMAGEKRTRAEFLLPPRGPQMTDEEHRRLRLLRDERARAVLSDLAVEPGKLRALNERTRLELATLVPPEPMRDGRLIGLVLPAEVPAEIRSGKANPWTVVAPPYPGWSWWYSGYLNGFGWSGSRTIDTVAGLIGNNINLTDGDASDLDLACLEYHCAVGFWYHMPRTGLIEAWIEGQSGSAHHHLTLDDEWGWSDSAVRQRNFLTVKAYAGLQSERRESQMSWFWEDGYTDGHWDKHYLASGATYWAHLFTDVSYAAGTWVYVEIGTRNYNWALANDVEVYSNIDFKWFVKRVWVDVA